MKNLARVLVKATIRGPYKPTPSAKLRHEIHGIKKRSASTRPGASPIFPPPRRPQQGHGKLSRNLGLGGSHDLPSHAARSSAPMFSSVTGVGLFAGAADRIGLTALAMPSSGMP